MKWSNHKEQPHYRKTRGMLLDTGGPRREPPKIPEEEYEEGPPISPEDEQRILENFDKEMHPKSMFPHGPPKIDDVDELKEEYRKKHRKFFRG